MTLDEAKSLTDSDLQHMVAKLTGHPMSGNLPDYTGDLNAMHVAERKALDHNYMAYWAWLAIIVDGMDVQKMSRKVWSKIDPPCRIAIATARQRAMAVVLTMTSPR